MTPSLRVLTALLITLAMSSIVHASVTTPLSLPELRASAQTLAQKRNYAQQIETHLNIATLLRQEGAEAEAIQELTPVLPLIREKGSARQLLSALNMLGALHSADPYPVDEGSMATNKAVRSFKVMRPDMAKEYLTEALTLARKENDVGAGASALNNLGNLYWTRLDYEPATTHYLESVQLARRSNDVQTLRTALANLGRCYVSTGNPDADASLREAYGLWTAQPDSRDKAEALLGIGQCYRRLAADVNRSDHLTKAATILEAAERTATSVGDNRLVSYAMGYGGAVAKEQGDIGHALAATRQALFLGQTLNSPELLYQWQWQLGNIHKAQGDRTGAISAYRMAVRSLQTLRRSIRPDATTSSLSFKVKVEPVYHGLVEMLLEEGDRSALPEDKARFLVEVQETLESLRTAELQDYLRDSCLGESSQATASSVVIRLQTAVVYLITLSDRLELIVNLPSGTRRFTTKVDAKTIAKVAHKFVESLATRPDRYLDYFDGSSRLYDMMIRPIEEALAKDNIRHLVILPDGVLRTVPMAALHDGDQFLIEKYTLSTTQGMRLVNASPPLPVKNQEVLMAGISEPVSGFSALPSVRDELAGISSHFNGKALLDAQFLKGAFKSALEAKPYSYVHLATHGEFAGGKHNMFILAWDGLITFDDLNSLIQVTRYRNEPLELLTLSACKTAVGDDQAALGLAGIAVKAGAKSTIATMWEIDDKVTAEIIGTFYGNLKKSGYSKAMALQDAQVKIMEEHRHPYYWAPFLLIGNWL